MHEIDKGKCKIRKRDELELLQSKRIRDFKQKSYVFKETNSAEYITNFSLKLINKFIVSKLISLHYTNEKYIC